MVADPEVVQKEISNILTTQQDESQQEAPKAQVSSIQFHAT